MSAELRNSVCKSSIKTKVALALEWSSPSFEMLGSPLTNSACGKEALIVSKVKLFRYDKFSCWHNMIRSKFFSNNLSLFFTSSHMKCDFPPRISHISFFNSRLLT